MNDLLAVRQALGQPEPPSAEACSTARAALLRQAAVASQAPASGQPRPALADRGQSRSRRRRTGWLAGGLGLTAAAAAAVVAVGLTGMPTATHAGHRNAPAGAASRLSARQILLAAATTAAAEPARSGAYWYLKETGPGSAALTTTQDWYTHDDADYHLAPSGKAVYLAGGGNGFSVGASSLTYQQIERLPTEPAALTAWITRSFYHPITQPLAPGPPHAIYRRPPRAEIAASVAISLSELLDQVPTPPAVQAAAFRALAALPNVTKLGQHGGDVVLRIALPSPPANKFPAGKAPAGAGEIRLVIDASTLALEAWSDYQGTTTVLSARWTNARPPVVPVSKLFPAQS